MSLYIPSFSEIPTVAQSRGALSEAPHLWDGLVGYWPMQEGGGSTAYDVSGWGNHGTLTNMDPATDWVVGEKGRCLDFDGTNDRVELGTLSFPAKFTLHTVFQKVNVAVEARVYSRGSVDGNNPSIQVFDSGVRGIIGNTNDGGGGQIVGSSAPITSVTWYTVDLTFDESRLKLYVNGQQEQDDAAATTVGSTAEYSTISGRKWPVAESFFGGLISDVRIFDRALLVSEIQQLYADPWAMGRLRARVFAARRFGRPKVYGSLAHGRVGLVA